MSKLGSLYITLGEPEGELCGCTCEVGDWAADEIERLRRVLELIKARVSGEACPLWDFGNAAYHYHSRRLIADWCDAVLSREIAKEALEDE